MPIIKLIITAINFLKARGLDEVGVYGFSVGGAVALMVAAQVPEIKAVVSESSYARLDLMTYQLYRIPVIKYVQGFLSGLWGKIFLGINLKEVSPMDAAKKLDIPVLLIHSKNDSVIPFSNALLLEQALQNNPKAEFWFKDELIHGERSLDYQQGLMDFFERSLD